MTDEREAKLPKWARDELSLLRRRIAERDTEIEALRGPAEGYVWSDWYDRVPVPMLPWRAERPQLYFGGEPGDGYFQVRFDPSTYELEVYGGASSTRAGGTYRDSTLLVQPVASNVLRVRHDNR